MTKSLQEAFRQASQLPEAEQDALAAAIKDEIAAEQAWVASLDGSRDALAGLAKDALRDHKAGRTKPVDPESM